MSQRWDEYCQLGDDDCLDQNCGCTDNPADRWTAARKRGIGRWGSLLHALWIRRAW